MADLAIIVPTRGRPENIVKVISAWDFTNAWDVADLVLAVDGDDPKVEGYHEILREFLEGVPEGTPSPLKIIQYDVWQPMVHKLDRAAMDLVRGLKAGNETFGGYFALGFAGDDHLPRTIDWAKTYLANLRGLRTGMVYSDDGYQGANLSSEWAITSDVVRALGRMIPAPVEHMYSDVSIQETMREAGALRYLDHVRIEHMHPIVGKAENDAQYQRVNHRDQFRADRRAYEAWQAHRKAEDVATVEALWPERPRPAPAAPRTPRRAVATVAARRPRAAWTTGPARSGPRTVKGPAAMPKSKLIPRYLRNIQRLTPPEAGISLADMARGVPKDQAIVELGVYQGFTAFMMAWGARQGHGAHVWGFDPWDLDGNVYGPEFNLTSAKHNARYNVMGVGHTSDVHLTQAFSVDAANTWAGPPVGLLHVDGDHTYQGCRQDIESWVRHLAPGATIAIDDYVEGDSDYEGLIRAVDDLVESGLIEPITVFHNRLAVTKLREEGRPVVTQHVAEIVGKIEDAPDIGDVMVVPGVERGAPVFPVTDQGNGTVMVENEPETAYQDPADQPGTPEWRMIVHEGEIPGIAAGTLVEGLSIPLLKALAKARHITLGTRKDKKSLIIEALRDGV